MPYLKTLKGAFFFNSWIFNRPFITKILFLELFYTKLSRRYRVLIYSLPLLSPEPEWCICMCISSYASTICWKDYFFSIALPLFCDKDWLTMFMWVYFRTFFSVPLIYLSLYVFLPTTHCLDYCSFISLELRSWPPNWFFTITPPILLLHICLRIIVNIHKITCWDFNWDCIESTDQVRKKLTCWQYCLPIHKHGMSSSVSTLHWFTEVL